MFDTSGIPVPIIAAFISPFVSASLGWWGGKISASQAFKEEQHRLKEEQIRLKENIKKLNDLVQILLSKDSQLIDNTLRQIYNIKPLLDKIDNQKNNLEQAEKLVELSNRYSNEIDFTNKNEYQEVLDTRAEIYQYWKEQNQKHLANIRKISHKPEQEKLWQKLESQKARHTSNILCF